MLDVLSWYFCFFCLLDFEGIAPIVIERAKIQKIFFCKGKIKKYRHTDGIFLLDGVCVKKLHAPQTTSARRGLVFTM